MACGNTYELGSWIYWYDFSLRLWSSYERDAEGNQVSESYYDADKADMKKFIQQRIKEAAAQ